MSGEMVNWLRALAALVRTCVQFPEPTWQLTIFLNSSFRNLTPSFSFHRYQVSVHVGKYSYT